MNIPADIAKYTISTIMQKFNALGFKIFVEGEVRDTAGETEWLEIRIEGPDIAERTQGSFQYDVGVAVLINIIVTDNIYRGFEIVNSVMGAFEDMCVLDGDLVEIGHLRLKQGDKGNVSTYNLGATANDSKLIQTTVIGHFYMWT